MLQFELTPKALVKDGFAARCEAALGAAVTSRAEYWAAPWSGSAKAFKGKAPCITYRTTARHSRRLTPGGKPSYRLMITFEAKPMLDSTLDFRP